MVLQQVVLDETNQDNFSPRCLKEKKKNEPIAYRNLMLQCKCHMLEYTGYD